MLKNNEFDKFIIHELYFHSLVKQIETKENFENCYRKISEVTKIYGQILSKSVNEYKINKSVKVCYFLPSLDNDLAHIEILYRILKSHSDKSIQIYIAGYCADGIAKSNLLNKLYTDKIIEIIPISQKHESILQFLNYFNENGFSQLVVYSAPTLLESFIAVLGDKKVTWFSSKYELECFDSLINRMSCCGSKFEVVKLGKSEWCRTQASINPHLVPHFQLDNKDAKEVKLITINREEKIRNIVFLDSVSKILKHNLNANFYWTGRSQDSFIQQYFFKQGISARTHFLGWINPAEELNKYDIFLDTPNISGTIAASAFTAGMPVVTFKNSQSYIEFYIENLNLHYDDFNKFNYKDKIISNNAFEYIKYTTMLINDINLRMEISEFQRKFGSKFFLNNDLMYFDHIHCLKKFIYTEITNTDM